MAKYLEVIRKTLARFDEELLPPANDAQIKRMVTRSLKELGASPPDGYCDFLRKADGLDFNGMMIYASSQLPDTEPDLPGFIEINLERFRGDLTGFERTLVFGEDSQQFYALDLDSGVYRVETWPGTLIKEFQTIQELLDYAMMSITKDL